MIVLHKDKMTHYKVFNYIVSKAELKLDLPSILFYSNYLRLKNRKGVIKSNIGGWQSPSFAKNQNVFFDEYFFPSIYSYVQDYAKFIGFNYMPELSNYWINFNYKDNSNEKHSHPRSIISGVYYVSVPENSGNFNIINPESEVLELYLSYAGERNNNTLVCNSNNLIYRNLCFYEQSFISRPNNLILFPSWMKHRVDLNRTNKRRVSIAFNFI